MTQTKCGLQPQTSSAAADVPDFDFEPQGTVIYIYIHVHIFISIYNYINSCGAVQMLIKMGTNPLKYTYATKT